MVERYNVDVEKNDDGYWEGVLSVSANGAWVSYSDCATLERQITELRADNERLQHKVDQYDSVVKALSVCDGGRYRNDTIESCVLALKARDAAEAENARLSRSLIEIMSLENKGASAHGKWGDAYRIARNTLSDLEPGK